VDLAGTDCPTEDEFLNMVFGGNVPNRTIEIKPYMEATILS
jgi:hypothetical protein